MWVSRARIHSVKRSPKSFSVLDPLRSHDSARACRRAMPLVVTALDAALDLPAPAAGDAEPPPTVLGRALKRVGAKGRFWPEVVRPFAHWNIERTNTASSTVFGSFAVPNCAEESAEA